MAIQTNKNILIANEGQGMYQILLFLKSLGWTVVGSGDGTSTFQNEGQTAGLGGTDPWNIFNPINGGAGAGGGAKGMYNIGAWFVMRIPGGGTREIAFQFNFGGGMASFYDPAGFGVGASNTAVPNGPNKQTVISQNFWGTFNRISFWGDNAAPYGFGFHCWNGAGANTCGYVYDSFIPGSFPATDQEPYVFIVGANDASYFNGANIIQNTNKAGWYKFGIAGAAWMAFNQGPGLASYNVNINFGNQSIPANASAGANPFNGLDDNLPVIYMRASTVANPGYRGVSKYLQLASTARPNLSTQTISTPLDRLILGVVSVPWGSDGVAPLP